MMTAPTCYERERAVTFQDPLLPTDLADQCRYVCQRLAISRAGEVAGLARAMGWKPQRLWNRLAAPVEDWADRDLREISDIAFAFGHRMTFSFVDAGAPSRPTAP